MTALPGRATIALSAEANAAVDDLCDRFPFKERSDAAKLGIAYAVRKGSEPTRSRAEAGSGPAGTTWGVGGFDNDGKLRELVLAVFPDNEDDPYATLETLMNLGVVGIGQLVREKRPQTLAELVTLVG